MVTIIQRRRLAPALLALLVSVAAVLHGCSDKLTCESCPTCEEPVCNNDIYDGRLYVSMLYDASGYQGQLLVIDTRTNEILDSLWCPMSGGDVGVTPDGKYVTLSGGYHETYVYDAATMEMVNHTDLCARHLLFTGPDGEAYLLGFRLNTYLMSFPDLEVIHQDTLRGGRTPRYSRRHNSLYNVENYRVLYEYSLDSFQIVRQWQPRDANGEFFHLWRFDISSDDSLAYIVTASSDRATYITYDLVGDSLVAEFPLLVNLGDVCVNPVNGEVYVTDPTSLDPENPFSMGTIYVLDGQTGEYLHGISLFGYLPDPREAILPWDMEMTPDGSEMYVAASHPMRGPGTVVRIDTRSRRIESLVFPANSRYAEDVVVGPRP